MSRRLSRLAGLLAAFGLLLCAGSGWALDPHKRFRDYVRDSWSIEQGLPQISAMSLAQDGDGYLWVGTQAGLARFDGHRFTVFDPETEPAVPGGWINDLLLDRDGALWVATYKGLARRRQGSFARIERTDAAPGSAADVTDLALAADGRVLAAIDRGVHAVEGNRLVLRHTLPGPARVLLPQADTLWVGSLGGVYRVDADGVGWLPLPSRSAAATVDHLHFAWNRLWAGTSAGLFVLDGQRWRGYSEAPHLQEGNIEALFEDAEGSLWVAELAHLTRLRRDAPPLRIKDGDAGLGVRSIFEDRERNLWLGSQWNGLTRLRNGWTRRFSRAEGLSTPLLWSLAPAADGGLWVGSDDGLQRLREGRIESVLPGSALPHPNAYTLRAEGDTVWIGTRGGLALWQRGELQQPARFQPLRGTQINALLRGRDGALWIATHQGLYRDDGQQLSRYDEADGLLDPRVRHLLLTRDGRLLVGSQSGPLLRDGERFRPLGPDRGLTPGLDITVQHELPDGGLVLGSLNETLHYFNGQHWTNLTPTQGVPRNAPFFIADHGGMLWVAGIRGIYRVPLDDLAAVADGRLDRARGQMLLNERGDRRGGQKGYCCNGAGLAKGVFADGVLWAPTRDGVLALDTADVRFPAAPPPTLVERWRIGSQWQAAPDTAVELPIGERDLAFEFTSISFQDPRSLSFRYRLVGYHDDWREPDEQTSRVAVYTNLGPGQYRFEAQGSVVEGQWSAPAAIEFRVPPQFTETRAFAALLGLLTLLLGVLIYLRQRGRYRRRAVKLERQVRQRTADLAEANRQLSEASLTDPLTGLRNRRYLSQQIPKDLAFYGRELRAAAKRGQVIVFALIDIDHFKRINDEFGHAAGDHVLQAFAELLLAQVRGGDYVARWGGEEFMVVFRPTPQANVPLLGERLCQACAAHPFTDGHGRRLQVTCSVGLVEYPLFFDEESSLDWEQLVELADRALYRVKRAGRNGWGAYRPRAGARIATIADALRLDEAAFEVLPELRFIGTQGEPAVE